MSNRVAIIGSRNYPEKSKKIVTDYVRTLPKESVIVSGGARGVDRWAVEAAVINGIRYCEHIPNKYNQYGDYLGHHVLFSRNTEVLRDGTEFVAFWDGESSGTHDGIKKAEKMGLPGFIVYPDGKRKPVNIRKYANQYSIDDFLMMRISSEIGEGQEGGVFNVFDKDPMSAMYHCWIEVDGMFFPSLRHAYYAACLFSTKDRINLLKEFDRFDLSSARIVRKPGYTDNVAHAVLTALTVQKFTENEFLHEVIQSFDPENNDIYEREPIYASALKSARKIILKGDWLDFSDPVSGKLHFVCTKPEKDNHSVLCKFVDFRDGEVKDGGLSDRAAAVISGKSFEDLQSNGPFTIIDENKFHECLVCIQDLESLESRGAADSFLSLSQRCFRGSAWSSLSVESVGVFIDKTQLLSKRNLSGMRRIFSENARSVYQTYIYIDKEEM